MGAGGACDVRRESRVSIRVSVGNLVLHGTDEFVRIAMSLSLG